MSSTKWTNKCIISMPTNCFYKQMTENSLMATILNFSSNEAFLISPIFIDGTPGAALWKNTYVQHGLNPENELTVKLYNES